MKPKPGSGKIQVGSLLTETIYLKAKAQAAIEKRTVGSLIDEAIELYLEKTRKGE
jgi:hypothetical protein